ncbi:hypothetical protein GF312_13795 [Candidatus Poribacteria bacterium]|nr:hypothetical protein [Candidatus Poribacteria bacterium]
MKESESIRTICEALSHIRIKRTMEEIQIQDEIESQFRGSGIPYQREIKVAPRFRLDFLVEDIAVEVKKRRPARGKLISQIERYASLAIIKGVIIVLEKNTNIPKTICDKPVKIVSLNRLWGVAL